MSRPLVNVKNIPLDIRDPDLKSYGKKLPRINEQVMKASLALRKRLQQLEALKRQLKK